jgi:hypothetical protein
VATRAQYVGRLNVNFDFLGRANGGCYGTGAQGLGFDESSANGSRHGAEREPGKGAEIGNNLSSLINRVSRASVSELDMLIAELQELRNFLLNEGQRIQREITEYTRANQATIESTRVITDSLARWKPGPNRR